MSGARYALVSRKLTCHGDERAAYLGRRPQARHQRKDMLHVYSHPTRAFELDDGFTMFIDGSATAELLEIGVVAMDGRAVIVHAMPACSSFSTDPMPRSVQDILDHADTLAKRFEDYEPRPEDQRDPEAYINLRKAVLARSEAERSIIQAVHLARSKGYSWRTLGSLIGTSGEAARQRYGTKQAV